MEGIDPLADKVGVLGGEFGSVEACNDADERRVALDVVAPMILAQAEAEDVIKLRFGAGAVGREPPRVASPVGAGASSRHAPLHA